MHLTSPAEWVAKFNIAAACLSFSFICAVVVGVF